MTTTRPVTRNDLWMLVGVAALAGMMLGMATYSLVFTSAGDAIFFLLCAGGAFGVCARVIAVLLPSDRKAKQP